MENIAFLLYVLAAVAASVGGWAKNHWALAAAILMIVAALFLGKVPG